MQPYSGDDAVRIKAMVDRDQLYSNLNEGILAERLGSFQRNLRKNIDLIRAHGGLRRIVPELDGKMAVVIAAGPSLEKNFSILRQYQHRRELVYIAADMALRPLARFGITPRFVVSCETSPVDFFGGIDTARMHLVAFSCMSHANLARWRGDVSFYNWMMRRPEYDVLWEAAGLDLGFVGTGGLVTTQAIAFALGCSINGLVLAGNDLGFTDRYHVRESVPCRTSVDRAERLAPPESREMDRRRRAMEYRIERGARSYYTTAQFLAGKMWLENLFRDSRIPVYDCSDPGCSEKYVAKMELKDCMSFMDVRTRRKRRKP
jgi:hypothetical protein